MRRYLFLLLAGVTLTFTETAHAETRYRSHVSVGGHAGASLSQMTFSPSVPQTMKPGITAGVSLRYAEERHVGLLAELNFTQHGWKETFEESNCSYSRTLNYLELPVMTHIFFGSRRFLGFVNLGPQIGFMIGESTSANFDYHNPQADPSFHEKNRMTEQMAAKVTRRFDYGITAGLGCEYYLTPRRSVALEARFYFGLGNVFPDSKKDTFGASRGMAVTITASYNFRLK